MPPIRLHCLGINKILKYLNPSKAAGSDGLPSRYLKLIADKLTPNLFLLFQLPYSKEEFLQIGKGHDHSYIRKDCAMILQTIASVENQIEHY